MRLGCSPNLLVDLPNQTQIGAKCEKAIMKMRGGKSLTRSNYMFRLTCVDSYKALG